VIVLGEKHNTIRVQTKQAEIIQAVQRFEARPFTVGWEFLNFTDKEKIARHWNQYQMGQISGVEFLEKTQGNLFNISYLPILDVIRTFRGRLIGLNLSREEKSPVLTGGLSALKPQYLPPDFQLGGAHYRERFVKTMNGHAPAEKIENYFTVQSLVDDWMAFYLLQDERPLKFLITGSFHMEFNDGSVTRIKIRNPALSIVTVRVIDASDYKAKELEQLREDPRYGINADYLVFVGEPKK
jgi:uncharacterized iron-regulated protein